MTDWVKQLPEKPPSDAELLQLDWPDDEDWAWPRFSPNYNDYNLDDEHAVLAVRWTTASIGAMRRLSSAFEDMCKQGATELRGFAQGRELGEYPSIDISGANRRERLDPEYKFTGQEDGDRGQLDVLADNRNKMHRYLLKSPPRYDDSLGAIVEWHDETYAAAQECIDAFDQGFGYESEKVTTFFGYRDDKAHYNPVPTEEHVRQLESAYEWWVEAVYSIQLDEHVSDIYETATHLDEEKYGF